MKVAMKQIAGLNFEAAYFDGLSNLDNVHVGVRHSEVTRKNVKSGIFGSRQVSHCAVGNHADAVKRPKDMHMH